MKRSGAGLHPATTYAFGQKKSLNSITQRGRFGNLLKKIPRLKDRKSKIKNGLTVINGGLGEKEILRGSGDP